MIDPSTFSNINEIKTKHMFIDWDIDFSSKVLRGSVTLTLQCESEPTRTLVLDTNGLNVFKVEDENSNTLEYRLLQSQLNFGKPLEIQLRGSISANQLFKVRIHYETTKDSGAIQWLEKEQTLGKKHPYLFTQCQAIYARSLVPCQDTPSIKFTYNSRVSVQKDLKVLMSAVQKSVNKTNETGKQTYEFEQKTPIPSYLLAIVAGNLESRELSKRSLIWSEPEIIEKCAFEFEQTEEFISIAEKLLIEYQWGRYDLLVLPPSFPYGGMENPCLTFVTPTLLAGDKSASDVVAHEIAHSWTGNLVTTQNWEHFWLNEGWTMFVERKIFGRIHGEKMRQLSSIMGLNTLKQELEFMKYDNPLTALVPKLDGIDPDDAFSSVPYEKGYNFLYYLENILGGPQVFEPYMKAYIQAHQNQSITTKVWKDFLYDYMHKNYGKEKIEILNSVEWDKWFYQPGKLIVENQYDRSLCRECEDLFSKWRDHKKASTEETQSECNNSSFHNLLTQQKIYLLDMFIDSNGFKEETIRDIDNTYGLTNIKNNEIKFRWQLFCLKNNYGPINSHVVQFLGEQGRMKYVRPLYRALNNTKGGPALAKSTFQKNKAFYHPIAASLIEKDLFFKQ